MKRMIQAKGGNTGEAGNPGLGIQPLHEKAVTIARLLLFLELDLRT
jgi:hypothetical protein